jgi:hypothetical protein
MTSRALMLASVLLFVNGCDYSQKKPQTRFGSHDPHVESPVSATLAAGALVVRAGGQYRANRN